jgi:hypothetical protein
LACAQLRVCAAAQRARAARGATARVTQRGSATARAAQLQRCLRRE